MRQYEKRYGRWYTSVVKDSPQLLDDVLAAVKELGPIGAGPLENALGVGEPRVRGGWWNRSAVKHACEFLFVVGELTAGVRQGFQRQYDLPERVLPPAVLAAPPVSDDDAFRELTRRAAIAHRSGSAVSVRSVDLAA